MSRALRIAIVGAGIGGLAAAALLARAGHKVQVFDQAPRFARVGAGIQMAPNAVRVLRLVRETLIGPERPRFTGRIAYRTILPAERLRGSRPEAVRTKWWGPDRHLVAYYVTAAHDELYFVTSVPEKADWITPESWSAKGDLDELRAAYVGFHPEVQALLQAASEAHKWGIFERDPLPRWYAGRVVLLGDACHPMTPYMAQGAAAALEDAVVLARCVAQADGLGLEGAFALYEATRKPRASAIQSGSSKN